MRKLLLRHGIQDIRLILVRVLRPEQLPSSTLLLITDPRVVAGYDRVTSQLPRPAEKLLEFHISIAVDTRVWRASGLIDPHKPVDHLLPEILSEVEDIVRHAQLPRNGAGILDVIQAAAGVRIPRRRSFLCPAIHPHGASGQIDCI